MYRVSPLLLLTLLGCTTPKTNPNDTKPKEAQLPPETNAATQPMKDGRPTPEQAILTTQNWLKGFHAKEIDRLTFFSGFPFYSYGLMPMTDDCKGKDSAATKEEFAKTAACILQSEAIRENIPLNFNVQSVFELKQTTLDEAFSEQKELTQLQAHKKDLAADCCRAYVQVYLPGDKANAYLLFSIGWLKGDIRVVGVVAELDPIE